MTAKNTSLINCWYSSFKYKQREFKVVWWIGNQFYWEKCKWWPLLVFTIWSVYDSTNTGPHLQVINVLFAHLCLCLWWKCLGGVWAVNSFRVIEGHTFSSYELRLACCVKECSFSLGERSRKSECVCAAVLACGVKETGENRCFSCLSEEFLGLNTRESNILTARENIWQELLLVLLMLSFPLCILGLCSLWRKHLAKTRHLIKLASYHLEWPSCQECVYDAYKCCLGRQLTRVWNKKNLQQKLKV